MDVLREAQGCAACIVGFHAFAIGAIELVNPFFGVAVNPDTGRIFLMQGNDLDPGSV